LDKQQKGILQKESRSVRPLDSPKHIQLTFNQI